MIPIPNISNSQNPTSGLRDLSNASKNAGEGLVGSVVNNFALGGSTLSASTGTGSEQKVLLYIGLAAASVFLILKFKK